MRGHLLVLRLLPFVARLGGRIAARGRGLGPALVGWQLARRPGRANGPVLLLVLAVAGGVLALGHHTAWTASQRDQADFATAGGLRITGSDLPPLGRGGRYAALPGGERVTPVIRTVQDLPGGAKGDLLAVDAPTFARRVPLRADLREGRSMEGLFTPLADGSRPAGIALPGQPRRVDLDVSVRAPLSSGVPSVSLLLRDRHGVTYRSPTRALPESGRGTVAVDLAALTGAPLGSAAAPLDIAGIAVTYGASIPTIGGGGSSDPIDAELTLHRVSVAEAADGAAVPVEASAPPWYLSPTPLPDGGPAATLPPPEARDGGALLRLAYRAGSPTAGGYQLALTTAGAPASEIPGLATHAYLKAIGSAVGDLVPIRLGVDTVPVRITAAVGSLPVVGDTAVAVDLGVAARIVAAKEGHDLPPPDEWWLPATSADDPLPARAAAELRAAAGRQQLVLREEMAAALLDDPLSAARRRPWPRWPWPARCWRPSGSPPRRRRPPASVAARTRSSSRWARTAAASAARRPPRAGCSWASGRPWGSPWAWPSRT
ncbi:hypothetical protein M4D82_03750 [Streptomyces sp. RerS4]|nr:hypothetical protein [Streptomyces sp. RerS4]UQW99749.1 hypothetical protein M4D82_03750 [Streptomyces sp. RerS4]